MKFGGIAEALCKMFFGNKIGVSVETKEPVFDLSIGSILVESAVEIKEDNFILLGKTTSDGMIAINKETVSIDEAISTWCERYHKIYPMTTDEDGKKIETPLYTSKETPKARKTYEKPKVIIPVFPGQNCEYDTKQQFERAGAEVEVYVFNNLNVESIERSLKELS